MSEDVAWKRIHVARTARRYVSIFERLADGRLTLTAVVLLGQHLTRENATGLLDAATHRTKREVQELLASRFPRPDLETLIASVAAPTQQPTIAAPEVTPVAQCSTSPAPERVPDICRNPNDSAMPLATPASLASPAPYTRVAPLSPERFALQLTLSRETHEKLRRAQELLGHAIPDGDVARVLDRALALLVAQLEERRCATTETPRPRRSHANARYVPAEVRREVFERDGRQCTFVSSNGHRCEARSRLELDHVIPLARGGRTESANLRLLCRQHNQLAAEQVLGRGFMNAKQGAGT